MSTPELPPGFGQMPKDSPFYGINLSPEKFEAWSMAKFLERLARSDLSDEACDVALAATATWRDIKGSALTVNREKMRMRFRALVEHLRKGFEECAS